MPDEGATGSLATGLNIMDGIRSVIDRTRKAAGAGIEEIKGGAREMATPQKPEPGLIAALPTGPLKVAKGAYDVASSPVTGFIDEIGDRIEKAFPKLKEAQENNPRLPNIASVIGTGLMLVGGQTAERLAEPKPAGLSADVPRGEPTEPPVKPKAVLGGAAATPSAGSRMGHNIAPDIVQRTSDDLYKLHNMVTADRIELGQKLDALPPEAKTREFDRALYDKAENPDKVLTPRQQEIFDTQFEPMRKEVQELSSKLGKYGVVLEDPEYMHRIMAGKAEHVETPRESLQDLKRATGPEERVGKANIGAPEAPPEAGNISPLPQVTSPGRSLSKRASPAMPRSLYVLEHDNGTRMVVSSPAPGKLTVWQKGKGNTVKWGDDLELGNPIMVQGQRWTVKQAKTAELESETPYRFHKSAMVNMADAVVRMRAAVRHMEYLDQITKTDGWLDHAMRAGGNRKPPEGWRVSKIPQLKDWVLHPDLADAFDDFYKPGFNIDSIDWIRRVNRFAVGSMFWQPIPHTENVAGHWYVGRGLDWVRPQQWKELARTGGMALKSVMTQDQRYQDMLKSGSALISGGVTNRDFYMNYAKKFGLDIERDPSKWEQVGRTLAMGKYDLIKQWYAGMNRVLWQANDVFMMQRVLELEGKGMSRAKAIEEAEKHIPNYRIPTKVMGQRWLAQFMQDQAFMSFGRYRYGVWNSYANMVRDAVQGLDGEKRKEAIGNMMALGSLALVIYPAISYGIYKLTRDDDAKKIRRGPAALPQQIYDGLTEPEKHWYDFIADQMTFAPTLKEIWDQRQNVDDFTGQHISPPGEHSVVRQVLDRAEHAMETMAAPYSTVNRMRRNMDEEGIPRQMLDQLIGISERTGRQERGIRRALKAQKREKRSRDRNPKGLIEEYGGALE